MFDRGEFGRWVAQAFNTLASSRQDLVAKSYNWCCFKAQQAAECAARGLLKGLGTSVNEHSLEKLLRDLGTYNLDVSDLMLCARILDRHYAASRYPDAQGVPFEFYDETTALEAMGCAERLCNFCDAKGKEYEATPPCRYTGQS